MNPPGQFQGPMENGMKEAGLLGLPEGVLKYFEVGSNLSGMNFSGSIH